MQFGDAKDAPIGHILAASLWQSLVHPYLQKEAVVFEDWIVLNVLQYPSKCLNYRLEITELTVIDCRSS